MPEPVAGDVLVVKAARVQSYRDNKSLITSKATTSLHIYSASQIPRPPKSARNALQPSLGKVNRQLGESEHEYVSWLYHRMDKDSIPDLAAFQTRVRESTRQKDKFCKLDSVINDQFCDVIVNVVKAPFDEMEKTTLWVSDYTENDNFHKFSWEETRQSVERDGHSSGGDDRAAKWAGPFGRRSMQITCFEPHASYVNSDVQLGQWIHIRNLRVKLGNNGINLEGVLHEDRDFHRRQVEILHYEDRDNIDPRLKEAIRRKLDYEKLKKNQMKSLKGNEERGIHGLKRKADGADEKGPNSRSRRKEMRQAAARKVEEQEKQAEERLGLSGLGTFI
jgi:protection of telomeres protein 1